MNPRVNVQVEVQPGIVDVRVVADVRPDMHDVAASGGQPMVVWRNGRDCGDGAKSKGECSTSNNKEPGHRTLFIFLRGRGRLGSDATLSQRGSPPQHEKRQAAALPLPSESSSAALLAGTPVKVPTAARPDAA